jgi:hypothetical protein
MPITIFQSELLCYYKDQTNLSTVCNITILTAFGRGGGGQHYVNQSSWITHKARKQQILTIHVGGRGPWGETKNYFIIIKILCFFNFKLLLLMTWRNVTLKTNVNDVEANCDQSFPVSWVVSHDRKLRFTKFYKVQTMCVLLPHSATGVATHCLGKCSAEINTYS